MLLVIGRCGLLGNPLVRDIPVAPSYALCTPVESHCDMLLNPAQEIASGSVNRRVVVGCAGSAAGLLSAIVRLCTRMFCRQKRRSIGAGTPRDVKGLDASGLEVLRCWPSRVSHERSKGAVGRDENLETIAPAVGSA